MLIDKDNLRNAKDVYISPPLSLRNYPLLSLSHSRARCLSGSPSLLLAVSLSCSLSLSLPLSLAVSHLKMFLFPQVFVCLLRFSYVAPLQLCFKSAIVFYCNSGHWGKKSHSE